MSGGDRLVNIIAEAALLGGLMLDNSRIVPVADRVRPGDFADAVNGRIYNVMLRFAAKGMRADATTLRPLFANDGDARYGEYLDDLVAAPAVKEAIDSLADQVTNLAARRDVLAVMRDAIDSLHDELEIPIDAITTRVETAGWAAASRKPVDVAMTAGEMIGLVEQRGRRIADDPHTAGITNALVTEWDDGLGNLERGTYNILAGRPGMGKSALANSLALGYATHGHCGLVLNHEMTAEQLALRTAADTAHAMGFRIPHRSLRKGVLNREEWAAMAKVRERAESLPVRFIATGRVDVKRVYSLAAQQKALWAAQGRKLDFVVIDYLGLLGATSEDGHPLTKGYDRVSRVSLLLKTLAHDLDVSLIALAQLSRGVEQRSNKRPILSDLKESGDLEQDADSVTFVFREEYYLEQDRPRPGEKTPDKKDALEEWQNDMDACRGKLDLIFAKNRHGKTAARTCKFLPEYSAVRSGDFNEFDDEADPLLF
jgi:replicative DNA helicase